MRFQLFLQYSRENIIIWLTQDPSEPKKELYKIRLRQLFCKLSNVDDL